MKSTVENIETRVSEIENIFLPPIRHDTTVAKENFNQILQFKDHFDEICDRIDNLELLVNRVKANLNEIEKQVEIAEEELDIPEKTVDILLKSFKIFAKTQTYGTNLDSDGNFKPPEIYSAKDYFE
jgi:biogenesis of lysosome-related organelles complex 1 subunit 4